MRPINAITQASYTNISDCYRNQNRLRQTATYQGNGDGSQSEGVAEDVAHLQPLSPAISGVVHFL